jgi:hypothetical protein
MTRRLRIVRNYGNRDPLSIPGAGVVWVSGLDNLLRPEFDITPPKQWFGEVITIEPEQQHNAHVNAYWAAQARGYNMPLIPALTQHNAHVMDYWTWRLERLERRRPWR